MLSSENSSPVAGPHIAAGRGSRPGSRRSRTAADRSAAPVAIARHPSSRSKRDNPQEGPLPSPAGPDAARRNAIDVRDVLVREAHHRIQNSLSLVVALLEIQRRQIADRQAQEVLQTAVSQVLGIAQVHCLLQNVEGRDNLEIDAVLAVVTQGTARLAPRDVEVTYAGLPGVVIGADRAVPISLICTELVTNALKHAFPSGRGGTVSVSLSQRDDGSLLLAVTDSGIGTGVAGGEGGLGSKVVQALARQIGAQIDISAQPGIGTTVQVRIPTRG